jgi:hypothetical protein
MRAVAACRGDLVAPLGLTSGGTGDVQMTGGKLAHRPVGHLPYQNFETVKH